MRRENQFLEWGVQEVYNDGERLGVVARFLLKGDRDNYLKSENADCKKKNAPYHYVPVRFRRPGGDR